MKVYSSNDRFSETFLMKMAWPGAALFIVVCGFSFGYLNSINQDNVVPKVALNDPVLAASATPEIVDIPTPQTTQQSHETPQRPREIVEPVNVIPFETVLRSETQESFVEDDSSIEKKAIPPPTVPYEEEIEEADDSGQEVRKPATIANTRGTLVWNNSPPVVRKVRALRPKKIEANNKKNTSPSKEPTYFDDEPEYVQPEEPRKLRRGTQRRAERHQASRDRLEERKNRDFYDRTSNRKEKYKTSNSSATRANYYASRKSEVFHKKGCHYINRIYDSNLIPFKRRTDASQGRRPCKVCKP